jgi:hypothetical protein
MPHPVGGAIKDIRHIVVLFKLLLDERAAIHSIAHSLHLNTILYCRHAQVTQDDEHDLQDVVLVAIPARLSRSVNCQRDSQHIWSVIRIIRTIIETIQLSKRLRWCKREFLRDCTRS